MKVLLIEPDRILGKTYGAALRQAGHKVVWCASAQTAIDAADSTRPDVVVTELQLPGHSGIEFLYEFRSYAEWQHIPVIIQTFVPETTLYEQRHHFARLGIADFLYKPTANLRQLVSTVGGLTPAST